MRNTYYISHARKELAEWQRKMQAGPGLVNKLTRKLQGRINNIIPEKIHKGITRAIKEMIRGVLFGLKHTSGKISTIQSLEKTEEAIEKKMKWYRSTAAAEGGVTGAGGFLLAAADFPILIGIKMRMLFDIAAQYGFDVKDYKERLYILYIFQLAFSGQAHRKQVYQSMTNWKVRAAELPEDIHQFDWRNFQQEYRDYLDLAKMAQLLPVVGAVVGVVVNYRLLKKLGTTAMNAYRMRLFEENLL